MPAGERRLPARRSLSQSASRWSVRRVRSDGRCQLLSPTLLVGFVYTILRGFREISASLLLSSYGNEPYSVVAYHMWDGGEVGKATAYGVVALCFMVVLVVVGQWIAGRKVIGPES